jgi:hypothetical protein
MRTGQLTLAMKIIPPEISPNAVNSSVGGRDGNTDCGGRNHITT